MRFREYVPTDLTEDSVYADKLIQILDELHIDKSILIDSFRRFHNPLLLTSVGFYKKFIKQLGDLYLVPGIPKEVFERLILNSWDIYSLKGTYLGLEILLKSISLGEVIVDASKLYSTGAYIVPDDFLLGYQGLSNITTPTSQEYADYLATVANQDDDFLFLFENNIQNVVPRMDITIITPFAKIKEFRDWLQVILPDFTPASINNAEVNINLYHQLPLGGLGEKLLFIQQT